MFCHPSPAHSRSHLAEEVAGVSSAERAFPVGLAQVHLHANLVLGLVGLEEALAGREKRKGVAEWGTSETWRRECKVEKSIEVRNHEHKDLLNAKIEISIDVLNPDLE